MSAWQAWIRPRRVVTAVGLVAAWCALWGELSWANVLSGLVLSVVVLSIGIGTAGAGGFRIGPLLRFAWLVAGDLVVSTISVAREVLTPTDHTREAIVAVRLPPASRRHLLLLSSAVTVTPGTAVVDVDADTATLYVHILHAGRRHAVEAHVRELAEVACRALPDSPEKPSWS